MNISSLSPSKIETYKSCPWLFYLSAILGLPDDPNPKTICGSIVHHVLEIMARAKKNGHYLINDKYINPNYLLKICWVKYVRENPKLEFTQEHYDFCKEMLTQVLKTAYNPLKQKIVAAEAFFELNMNDKGFQYKYKNHVDGSPKEGNLMVRGIIDLVIELDEDTIEIVDYKTGQRKDWNTGKKKQLEDFYKDTALNTYDLAAQRLFPQYKNRIITLIYIRDGGPYSISMDSRHNKAAIDTLRKSYRNILFDENVERLKDQPNSNSYYKCNKMCSFGTTKIDGKSLCDILYKEFNAGGKLKSTPVLYEITSERRSLNKRSSLGKSNKINLRNW